MRAYDKLVAELRKISLIERANGLLGWDHEIYMPKGEADLRAEEMSVLASISHEMATSPAFGKLLAEASREKITPDERVVVDEALYDFERDKRIPKELVAEFQAVTAKGFVAWERARKEKNFKLLSPVLKQIVDLNIKIASLAEPEMDPYAAMLKGHDKDLSLRHVREMLSSVRSGIRPIIIKARKQDTKPLTAKVPIEVQERFNKGLLESIGYDFNRGRLDVSPHPFSVNSRITTRYGQNYFESISGIMHEAGHAFYDMAMPTEHLGTALGEPLGLSIHESQSRIWENHIGKGLPFWKHHFPRLRKAYGLKDLTLDKFYRAINSSQPSFIRADADELTYPLHVILRFELEQDLVEGKLKVDELPSAWNEKFEQMLGIVPKDDAQGCLQDMHWPTGSIGYFPTYVIGSMTAAQLYAAAKKQMPQMESRIEKGDTSAFHKWLRDNVHSHASRLRSDGLMRKATGNPIGPEDYLKYLGEKFSSL